VDDVLHAVDEAGDPAEAKGEQEEEKRAEPHEQTELVVNVGDNVLATVWASHVDLYCTKEGEPLVIQHKGWSVSIQDGCRTEQSTHWGSSSRRGSAGQCRRRPGRPEAPAHTLE